MAACNFSFDLNETAETIVSKAKSAISKAGGTFTGNDASGDFVLSTFAGKIVGSYTVSPTKFDIVISDKPMFVSCSLIEQELKKFL